jgi:rare lipoprotein A
VRAAEGSQVGKAAWYDFVGKQTASGEILDTVTATAAHRSLPLASFANVKTLDNGRSVIAKINDRGPYIRGLYISPVLVVSRPWRLSRTARRAHR